jgi:hypothetical protein
MKALCIGEKPPLHYSFVAQPPYDAVVVGSMGLGELLCFQNEAVLQALAEGKPAVFYTPGLPRTENRGLRAALSARYRELKSWGAVFTDGDTRRVITAEQAALLVQRGEQPPAGAVLTPSAKEILGRN